MSPAELRATFTKQAEALKFTTEARAANSADDWLQGATDYLAKACLLANRIGIAGEEAPIWNGAWFGPSEGESLIPVQRVYSRRWSAR